MIKLLIEDYCHDCDGFEPMADREKIINDHVNLKTGEFDTMVTTTVACKSRYKCRAIERYLRKQLKKQEDEC